MKRIKLILVITFGLLLFAALLRRSPSLDPLAPRFVRFTVQPAGPFGREDYDWAAAVPFQGGKVWIMTHLSATNRHYFLYDIDRRALSGELLNAGAIFCNRDETKLFCEGSESPVVSLQEHIFSLIDQVLPGKLSVSTNRIDSLWILDLRDNSTRELGNISQFPGMGSRWTPSPGFRYGYTTPTTSQAGREFYLCDLETPTLERVKFDGALQGWWDEHDLIIKDSQSEFVLFDILTRKTAPLFNSEYIRSVLKENGLSNDSDGIGTFFSWNGTAYDFYFFSGNTGNYKPDSGSSFLLKADRAGRSLHLHSKKFQFGYMGWLNETGTYYVYNGESGELGQGGNGAVFLRDLRQNTDRILIPPDNAKHYALARLYGDSVIYWRDKVFWRTDVKGTNSIRLLPVTAAGR